jgi:hypothetical protein
MRAPGFQWTPSEASSVNEFLNTPLGQKWLGVLITRKPRMDLSTTERAALSGAFVAGYEAVFGEIAATRTAMMPDKAEVKAIDPTVD